MQERTKGRFVGVMKGQITATHLFIRHRINYKPISYNTQFLQPNNLSSGKTCQCSSSYLVRTPLLQTYAALNLTDN